MHSNHAITDRIFRTNQYLLVEYLISKENKRASQYILEYVHLNLEDLRYPIGKINDQKKNKDKNILLFCITRPYHCMNR